MGIKNLTTNLLKSGLLVLTAGLMMGNQSCEQQTVSKRELKRIVEMGKIASPKVNLPQGGTFDFEFVANQQVYGVLQKSEHFFLRYAPPTEVVPSGMAHVMSQKIVSLPGSANDRAMLKAFAANRGLEEKPQYSKEAECMINLPSSRIAGSVNAFELVGGVGVNIGFNQAGPISVAGLSSVGLNIQWAQLDLSMMATHPLTQGLMAAANVDAKQTKTQVNFALDVGGFSVGPSAYYQTPLARVTEKALTKGVDSLYKQISAKEEWYSRVLMNHDSHLVILGGANLNIKQGDKFNVYNETYYWEGEPCSSHYYGGGASKPVATIEIDWVGDEVSQGIVVMQTDDNPVLGAKVKVFKLVEDQPSAPAPK